MLYRHFSDKADLVEAMGERATEILLDRLIPALNSEEAPLPRIRKSIDAVLGTLEEYPNLYWVLARHGHGAGGRPGGQGDHRDGALGAAR